MLLDKHERKYKRFLAFQKEYNSLLEAERKLPWTEVKPYQDGWFIYIDFRDEVKRRADYPFLKAALDLVHKRGRTKDPKLVNRLRSTKRLDQFYRLFGENSNYLRYISESYADSMYESSNWYYHGSTPPVLARCRESDYEKQSVNVKKWLCKVTDNTKYWGERVWYKAALPDHFLKIKTRPAYVTHVRDIDPQLMRRKAEVDAQMDELGRDFYHRYRRQGWANHMGNKAFRAATRAQLQKILKGEKEDFELKKKIRNYD